MASPDFDKICNAIVLLLFVTWTFSKTFECACLYRQHTQLEATVHTLK